MRGIGSRAVFAATVLSLASCQSTSGTGSPVLEPGPVAPATSPDVRPGPFTAEQVARGEVTFEDACSRCHEISRFSTETFLRAWTRAPLNQLFGFIATRMPQGAPGSLSRPQYADLVAYILARNGIPAGDVELPTATAALAQIRIAPP